MVKIFNNNREIVNHPTMLGLYPNKCYILINVEQDSTFGYKGELAVIADIEDTDKREYIDALKYAKSISKTAIYADDTYPSDGDFGVV